MSFGGHSPLGIDGNEVKFIRNERELGEDFLGCFIFHRAKNDGGLFSGVFFLPSFDEGAGGVGVMGGVEDKLGGDALEAARPLDVLKGVLDDVEGKVVSRCDDCFAGEGGVLLLVFAGKGEGVTQ